MTRTSPLSIVILALLGAGGGWLLEVALVATGRAVVTPPLTLGFALAAIGAILIALALPVRRAVRGRGGNDAKGQGRSGSLGQPQFGLAGPSRPTGGRIDPFYATRVVVLAKASSLSGALIAGAGASILVFLLSRSVIAAADSVALTVATIVGAIVLLVCGLVAEQLCTIPPDDDDKRDDAAVGNRL